MHLLVDPRTLAPMVGARLLPALDRLARRLDVELIGLENIPKGRALLVTNHAFGFDVALLVARIRSLTGRKVWILGEHAWWRIPGARLLAEAAGTVDGTPENADRLLGEDALVLVLPGGLREAMKPRELRYRLLWGARYGFVRAAMRRRAPIVPIATIGADDIVELVGNAFDRARRLHLPFPLPRPAGLPHRRAVRYVIGEPVMPPSVVSVDERAHCERRLRREVEGAMHEMFEEHLAHRFGFPNAGPQREARAPTT